MIVEVQYTHRHRWYRAKLKALRLISNDDALMRKTSVPFAFPTDLERNVRLAYSCEVETAQLPFLQCFAVANLLSTVKRLLMVISMRYGRCFGHLVGKRIARIFIDRLADTQYLLGRQFHVAGFGGLWPRRTPLRELPRVGERL